MTPAAEGWRTVAAEMIAGTRDALARFPVTSLFLLAAALDANWLIQGRGLFGGGNEDFIVPLVGGALGSLAASLFWEPRSRGLWVGHCSSLVAGVACFALLQFDGPARTLEWTLMAALAGLVPVAGFLGRGTSGAFWLFAARLAFAVVLAFLALLLFAGGISAILASLTYLFGIGVPDRLYSHIWMLTGLFAAPLFGLGQIPADFTAEPDVAGPGFTERGIRALGEFVAAPLLIVYAAILHAYALKIVLTRDVPQGQIGWLVLAFGLCTVGSLIVCRPFMRMERAPTRLFLRVWPFLLPVPLLLLAYALYLRIGAYGLTPERYLLALFGAVLLVLLMLQFSARTRGDIRLMAALPAVALFLASFGPQGAEMLSVRSQAARFLAIVKAPPVDRHANGEALAALRYLSSHGGLARIRPEGFEEPENPVARYRALALAWGLDPDQPNDSRKRYFSPSFSGDAAIVTEGFDLTIPNVSLFERQRNPVSVTMPDGRKLVVAMENGGFVISREGDPDSDRETFRFSLDAGALAAIVEREGGEPPRLVASDGERRILLLPSYLYGMREPEPRISNFTGAILLRSADWK